MIRASNLKVLAALLVAAVCAAMVVALGARSAHAAFPGSNGSLAYDLSSSTQAAQVYRMSTDGFGKTKLSDTAGANSQPDWSSNGKKVAFTNTNAGNSEIYWIGAWGSAEVNLTRNPANDGEPSFFPDYHKIAFSSNRGGNWDIWVMTVDNQGVPVPKGTFRVRGANTPNIESQPSVSPDGNYIAFVSEDPSTGDKNIAVVTSPFVDSSTVKPPNLPCMSNASEEFPEWAPDGKNIFFASNRSGNYDIFRHTTEPPPPPPPWSPPPPRSIARRTTLHRTSLPARL